MKIDTILLDTCALIWLANGDPMSPHSLGAIQEAAAQGAVFASVVSAWEIGLLAANPKSGVTFSPSPEAWFQGVLEQPGMQLAPLTAEAAIASSFLPGKIHADPADRMLLATARQMQAHLVTRDKRLVAYGQTGHVNIVVC